MSYLMRRCLGAAKPNQARSCTIKIPPAPLNVTAKFDVKYHASYQLWGQGLVSFLVPGVPCNPDSVKCQAYSPREGAGHDEKTNVKKSLMRSPCRRGDTRTSLVMQNQLDFP